MGEGKLLANRARVLTVPLLTGREFDANELLSRMRVHLKPPADRKRQ